MNGLCLLRYALNFSYSLLVSIVGTSLVVSIPGDSPFSLGTAGTSEVDVVLGGTTLSSTLSGFSMRCIEK